MSSSSPHSKSRAPAPARHALFLHLRRWIGILLVWLLVIEGAAHIALRLRPEWRTPDVPWAEAECFAGLDWIDAYFREWWQVYQARWEPYVYWRTRAFDGEFIRIGTDGIRATWQPDTLAAEPMRVLLFGGSTLWGLGARDDYTIPSLISRRLAESLGPHVEVINYGELGYVNTQELIQLLRDLQAQRTPDLVIFYDGVNDVFAAYQSGRAGIPQNEYRRAKEFNLLQVPGDRTFYLLAAGAYRLIHQSAALRLAGRWAGVNRPGAPAPIDADQLEPLAADVHEVYARNLRMVRALGNELGFNTLFYWQPAVFSKPTRSPHEAAQAEAFAALGRLYVQATQRLHNCPRLGDMEEFHSLADLFETVTEPIFFDYCHTGERGNALVAERMAGDILRLLAQRMQEDAPSP